MTPKVSWIIPALNGMPWLSETLESIARQTYTDYEVLVWDNGSTDGSVAEARKWIPSTLPGRVIADRPMGLGASLAALVLEAQGELLARIDADDVNEADRLRLQVQCFDEHPDWAAVGAWMSEIDETGAIGKVYDYPPSDPREVRLKCLFGNHLCHPTMCLRRDAVLRAGNYRDLKPLEDYDLWLRLLALGPIGNIQKPLVRYRRHENAVMKASHPNLQKETLDLILGQISMLLPGVSREDFISVWIYFSPMSPTFRKNRPPKRTINRLLRATAQQTGWSGRELLAIEPMNAILGHHRSFWEIAVAKCLGKPTSL